MSDNRLDDPVFVNASPPPEPPLLDVADPCPRCNGVGRVLPSTKICPNCRGTGHAPPLPIAEPCPACYGFGNLDPEGDPAMRCLNCGGTGSPPHSVTEDDGDIGTPFLMLPVATRPPAADGLAAAARKLLTFDGDDINDDLRTLADALRRYEEAS